MLIGLAAANSMRILLSAAGASGGAGCSRSELSTMVLSAAGEAFGGAGSPRPELLPQEVPDLLMVALKQNDVPVPNAGLQSVWDFSSDTTKFVYQDNITEFMEDAHKTAESLPTSFYGVAMKGKGYIMEGKLHFVGGSDDPWIATQIMRTISSDGRMRRWQWELRKHRRPPNLGAWYVESIGSSDRRGNFDVEG